MTDPVPPTPPTPPTPPAKAKGSHGVLNKKFLQEVADAQQVATAALDPANAPALAAADLPANLPVQVNTLAGQIDEALGTMLAQRVGKKELTAEEKVAHDALLAILGPIQTAAKRTFKGDQKTILEAYFIGSKLNLGNKSLDEVITCAKSILARLTPGENNAPPMDVLPGIKADGDIQDLSDAIAAYDAKNQAQTGQQTMAAGTLEAIQTQVTQLIALRHDLQLAADQAFPWRKAGVKTIRKAFLLPPDRPLGE